MFIKYPKIKRLGSSETEGILLGKVYVQEKLDGANTSIWMEDGEICMASRNQKIGDGFNGFCDYVRNHEGIKKLLEEIPNIRLYGEWLVRHTISYDETAYKQFYLFDVKDEGVENPVFMSLENVYMFADIYHIQAPVFHGAFSNPSLEKLNEFVGISSLGTKGEGIVLKNFEFTNKFGDFNYAKMVDPKFTEDNAIVFGGNNKYSDTYMEMYIVNKYITLARIEKTMHKIQPLIDERLDMKHTKRVISTVFHDMLTEEIWAIQKKAGKIDFRALNKLACRKAARMYHDILNNHLSVAYETNNIEGPTSLREDNLGEEILPSK